MLPIDNRISRAQRLLEIIEEDAPFLARRVAELTPERQKQAKGYVAEIAAQRLRKPSVKEFVRDTNCDAMHPALFQRN